VVAHVVADDLLDDLRRVVVRAAPADEAGTRRLVIYEADEGPAFEKTTKGATSKKDREKLGLSYDVASALRNPSLEDALRDQAAEEKVLARSRVKNASTNASFETAGLCSARVSRPVNKEEDRSRVTSVQRAGRSYFQVQEETTKSKQTRGWQINFRTLLFG